jgi:hypothetical protein
MGRSKKSRSKASWLELLVVLLVGCVIAIVAVAVSREVNAPTPVDLANERATPELRSEETLSPVRILQPVAGGGAAAKLPAPPALP